MKVQRQVVMRARKIAQKWIKAKNRRRVTERALKSVESAGD